jgi:hypothetical protein
MIYIAIDNSSRNAKKIIDLIAEMPFATIYKEFNPTTEKAFKQIEKDKTSKAMCPNDLLKNLNV